MKLITIIALIAIVFSIFNTYLILTSRQTNERLDDQNEQINELQNSLQQLNNRLDLLMTLDSQIAENEEHLNEIQRTVDNLVLEEQPAEQNVQQISELRTDLDDVRVDIEGVKSDLSNLANQISSLNQSTSTVLNEIENSIQTVESLISELSDLEVLVNQLIDQTPGEVYDDVFRSVVVIRTPSGQGSGFIFETSNIIVTNYHVVTDENDIEIEFFDRTRTQATVIGSDAYSDVAVLTVTNTPSEAIPLVFSSLSDVYIGQRVVAIGNPLGLTESLSVGYISQVNRLLDIEPIIVPVLQLDLTIAPGSSGGPLLDLSGGVIGITNAGTEVGFNFAVPVNILRRVVPALIEDGEYVHPLIGVSTIALTPDVISSMNILNVDPYQTGLLITEVVPDLPADQAGLVPTVSDAQGLTARDIITAIDGNPTFSREDLTAYMELEVSPGQAIILTLWRSGDIETVTIVTTERPAYLD